jgi:hypothetical protein
MSCCLQVSTCHNTATLLFSIKINAAAGRKLNATHFVAIDADEVISALWLRGSLWWDTLAGLPPGTTMYTPCLSAAAPIPPREACDTRAGRCRGCSSGSRRTTGAQTNSMSAGSSTRTTASM